MKLLQTNINLNENQTMILDSMTQEQQALTKAIGYTAAKGALSSGYVIGVGVAGVVGILAYNVFVWLSTKK